MNTTRKSVLLAFQTGEGNRFVDLYQPLITYFLVKLGVHQQDVEDLAQDVLAVVVGALPKFTHNGRKGAFRAWLRVITTNRVREWWRKNRHNPQACGGSDFLKMVEQLEDPASALSGLWDREHDQQVLQRLLSLVERSVDSQTKNIFHRLVYDNARAADIAAELNIDIGIVYAAKSRTLHRLRDEAKDLLDLD
jgi:RNA polymerase sigma-70 factor (ECF subfamily)